MTTASSSAQTTKLPTTRLRSASPHSGGGIAISGMIVDTVMLRFVLRYRVVCTARNWQKPANFFRPTLRVCCCWKFFNTFNEFKTLPVVHLPSAISWMAMNVMVYYRTAYHYGRGYEFFPLLFLASLSWVDTTGVLPFAAEAGGGVVNYCS